MTFFTIRLSKNEKWLAREDSNPDPETQNLVSCQLDDAPTSHRAFGPSKYWLQEPDSNGHLSGNSRASYQLNDPGTMVTGAGIEPAAPAFSARCSTC